MSFLDENRGLSFMNVQEPVRESLTMLTKAVRSQSAQILTLDNKLAAQSSATFTRDAVTGLVEEILQRKLVEESSRAMAAQQASSEKLAGVVGALEARLAESQTQLSRMAEIVQHQSAAITDLNHRLERTTSDIEAVQQSPPSIDSAYAYADKQLASLGHEVDRKLSGKADQTALDLSMQTPRRIEESIRTLTSALADLKLEVDRKATAQQFHALASQKVDHDQYIELLAAVHEKVSMTQLTSSVNNQVKPLVVAVAALEKAVVIQDATLRAASATLHDAPGPGAVAAAAKATVSAAAAVAPPSTDTRAVTEIVESLLRTLGIHPDHGHHGPASREAAVTSLGLESAISRQHDSLIREVTTMTDHCAAELRREMHAAVGGVSQQASSNLQRNLEAVGVQLAALSETQLPSLITAQVQQLAASVSKELRAKADKSDLVRLSDHVEELEASFEQAASFRAAESAAAMAEASRIEFEESFYDATDRTPPKAGGVALSHSPLRAAGGRGLGVAVPLSARKAVVPGSARKHAPAPAPASVPAAHTPRKSQAIEAIQALESVHAEAEMLRRGLLLLKSRAEKAELETAALRTQVHEASKEREAEVQRAVSVALAAERSAMPSGLPLLAASRSHTQSASASGSGSGSGGAVAVSAEWRLALGELGTALRKELADRPTRTEVEQGGWAGSAAAILVPTVGRIETALATLQQSVASKCDTDEISKVWHDLRALQSRIASELTGALWLWTSRQLIGPEGVVPWDSQVMNAAPTSLLWRKGSGMITVRLPGLYRLSLAVFTTQAVKVTICLNDEPLFSTFPESLMASSLGTGPEDFSMSAYHLNAASHREDKYMLRRLRHSAGEVTAVSVDEVVSLPADAVLAVKFQSPLAAQAVLTIRKL